MSLIIIIMQIGTLENNSSSHTLKNLVQPASRQFNQFLIM